ncbi:MAG: class I tRNA ligase family protein, partial [Acidobacteria bacterium]|nr:class I tRNA ligase family protein [Acidobacteriota bacterium]
CGGARFRKEMDILDVWFESGSSHLAVLNQACGLPWPSDLYLEGGDQHRGWFHSSLLVAVGLRGAAPYRHCATHGFVLDAQGRAMSKSLGNFVAIQEMIDRYGAEVLRLWAASVDFVDDVGIADSILDRQSEAYRKLRNTFRYALGNLADFDPERDAVPGSDLLELDQWILMRAAQLVRDCRGYYEDFAFHRVYHAAYAFATVTLSALYFDVLKDRLYTAAPRSPARRSAQTALHRLTYALVRLLAPVLSFTTEEVWGHLTKPAGAPESVHLALFPEPEELTAGLSEEHLRRAANFEKLLAVRDEVLMQLETARQQRLIGAPLEAQVRLCAGGEVLLVLEEYAAELPGLFIVSQVKLERTEGEALLAEVSRADGAKCERCWKYSTEVGADARWPTICPPCAAAVTEILNG